MQEFAIQSLGEARIDNPKNHSTVSDAYIPLYVSDEFLKACGHTSENDARTLYFQEAGPRKKIFFAPEKNKAAIVTCGGLCPGLNDVIRSVVMELWHGYGVRHIVGIPYGLEGFVPEKYGHALITLTPDVVSMIYMLGGTILGSSRGPQDFDRIAAFLEEQGINLLFVLGGDGTMKAAQAISAAVRRKGLVLSVIGVPKTIDNDINFVEQSFGFATAVDEATKAIAAAHTEAVGMYNGIGIVRLMGRESGFIAAHAALSLSLVNFVLVPEAPFVLHGEGGLLPALKERLEKRHHALLVVAEGAGQHLMPGTGEKDSSGNVILQDIGLFLQKEIKAYFKELNMPAPIKYIDPSYMVRAVPANADDRVYCGCLGRQAVHAGMSGKTEMVVAKLMGRYVHLPFALVTRQRRRLDTASHYWFSVLSATGQGALKGMTEKKE